MRVESGRTEAYRFKRSLLWIKNVFPSGNTRESFPFWNRLGLGTAPRGQREQLARLAGMKEPFLRRPRR